MFAMNGDELVDVDFPALLGRHRATGAAATVSVARPASPFGVVELTDDDASPDSAKAAGSRTG